MTPTSSRPCGQMVEPCDILAWDSSFWRARIAKARTNALTPQNVHAIDAWCARNDVDCLYFLARSDDAETMRLAEDHGFRLVDIRLSFEHRLDSGDVARPPEVEGPIIIRAAREDDIPALQAIARGSYHDTRFYYDERFPEERCHRLYETWIRRSCEGFADAVLVAERASRPVGYVTCHLQGKAATGSIGLVGVDQAARGQHVGQALVRHALAWFAKKGTRDVTVVTQGRNIAAQRLYQRCGFLTKGMEHWHHKWYV